MIAYISAVLNEVNHQRCQSLVPWKIQAFRGFAQDAFPNVALFGDSVDPQSDWIIHIDEDVFCYAPDRIDEILRHMQENHYEVCGVPEGGVVTHRKLDPLPVNMSFVIAHVAKFRQWRQEFVRDDNNFSPDLEPLAPYHLLRGPYSFGWWEPQYPWFYFLLRKGVRFLYLDAQMDEDGVSCHILDHQGRPFAAHAFKARGYTKDESVRNRIDALFEKCQQLRGTHGHI